MKHFLFFLFFLITTKTFSSDEVLKCRNVGSSPLTLLEKNIYSCGFQKGIAEFEGVKEEHRKNIYEKLSKNLALQIKQNLEETALLTTYFKENNDDLTMGSAEVKSQCRLDHVRAIQSCGGKKAGPLQEMKLNLLKMNIKGKDETSPYGDDLYGILAGKYVKNLGVNQSNENKSQCPVDGDAGGFILNSQLDEISAEHIIETLSLPSVVDGIIFDNYVQLKLIKDTNDPEFIEKFKKYVKEKPKDVSAKEYISKFFIDKDNQKKLATAVASQCATINNNINKFLCSDLDELGSLNSKTSISMFNGLDVGSMNDQYDVDFNDKAVLTAYGFQCLAKEKSNALVKSNTAEKTEQRLDDWYAAFTKNTRQPMSEVQSIDKTKRFCDLYSCNNEKSKSAQSCLAGGPISSSDLGKMFECNLNPRGKDCTSDTLKAVEYISSLEKLKQSVGLGSGEMALSRQSSDEKIKKVVSSLPDFAENYLGVEGSLIALGKPVTVLTLTEKTQEFKDRNLNSSTLAFTPAVSEKRFAGGSTNLETLPQNNSIIGPSEFADNKTIGASDFVKKTNWVEADNSAFRKPASTNNAIERDNSDPTREDLKKDLEDLKKTIAASNSSPAHHEESAANYEKIEGIRSNNPAYESWAKRLRDKESSLSGREGDVNARESDVWRREQLVKAREEELAQKREVAAENSHDKTDKQTIATNETKPTATRDDGGKKILGKPKAELAAELNVSSLGLTVTPEKLDKLEKKDLKELGVNIEEPFVISILLKGKVVHVRVAKATVKGKSFLVPRLNEDNKEVKEVILKSPIFKEFRYFYEKENSSYFPVK